MTKHWQADSTFCRVPNWVPHFALRYLAHTEKGISIRELARSSQVHASTVLRQIRRVETKRDDPLFDEALSELAAIVSDPADAELQLEDREMDTQITEAKIDDVALKHESKVILQELSNEGSVLAFAKDMEKAVVVREMPDGSTRRSAIVDRCVAQAMALQDWISCNAPGRISRYQITPTGRTELARLMALDSNSATGLAGASTTTVGDTEDIGHQASQKRVRFTTQENPIAVLARRRDKGGQPFLKPELVAASERLREDFELSQIGTAITQNWDRFLTAGTYNGRSGANSSARSHDAHQRFTNALESLGEGLSEIALRCCCHQEGMVTIEKRLGWPARSGKVVLRIALIKLREHYLSQPSETHDLIG